MIPRRLLPALATALDESPAVALLGPRQAGKTTLALDLARARPSVYLDLESDADRTKLSEPELYLSQHADKLVILDEIQRTPHCTDCHVVPSAGLRRRTLRRLHGMGTLHRIETDRRREAVSGCYCVAPRANARIRPLAIPETGISAQVAPTRQRRQRADANAARIASTRLRLTPRSE